MAVLARLELGLGWWPEQLLLLLLLVRRIWVSLLRL